MKSRPFWDEFAEVAMQRLVGPNEGDPVLVLAATRSDLNLAQALMAAGARTGADTQLIIKQLSKPDEAACPGPILSEAFKAAKYIVSIIDDGIDASLSLIHI